MSDNLQNLADSDGVSVHGGFPNPALDHRTDKRPLSLDLNQLLVKRPSSTYLFRVEGHTWADQGIYDGDIAVIDRAPQATSQDLVVARRLHGSTIMRQSQLTPEDQPWGVVTAVIHQYRP